MLSCMSKIQLNFARNSSVVSRKYGALSRRAKVLKNTNLVLEFKNCSLLTEKLKVFKANEVLTEQFTIDCCQPKPTLWPHPGNNANIPVNQSELETKTCYPCLARENAHGQVVIGFSSAPYWLKIEWISKHGFHEFASFAFILFGNPQKRICTMFLVNRSVNPQNS